MRLDTEFYKLPICFDVDQLVAEVTQFSESDWRAHPEGHPGNSAIALIAAHGDPGNDSVKGAMRPTPHLDRCPYLQQVLTSLNTVLGRTRLMRIGAQAEATVHVDTNYYWLQRMRVHVPIITFPEVEFLCGTRSTHMAAGETWIFNTWLPHNVVNPTQKARIHLVTDTVGSAQFWQLVDQSERPFQPNSDWVSARFVPYNPALQGDMTTENINFPVVMSPWEQASLIDAFGVDLQPSKCHPSAQADLNKLLKQFQQHWRALWAQYGVDAEGWPLYRQALNTLQAQLEPFRAQVSLPHHQDAIEILLQMIVRPALNPDLSPADRPAIAFPKPLAIAQPSPSQNGLRHMAQPHQPRFDRPIFIVSAPRSGSTLLFELLERSPSVYTIGDESHLLFESIDQLNPAQRGYSSNRLTAEDADPTTVTQLQADFVAQLRDRQGQPLPASTTSVRLLEKTPKNALRVPFLNAAFPDARFIYLYREPHENISSILEAWQSGRFITYPHLPDWANHPWSLLLIPDWRSLQDKSLPEIAAAQWAAANQKILEDLALIDSDRWCSLTYADLVANPQAHIQRLCEFVEIEWDQELHDNLPHSKYTLTAPHPNKWKKNAAALATVLPQVEPVAARARAAIAQTAIPHPAIPQTTTALDPVDQPPEQRSIHPSPQRSQPAMSDSATVQPDAQELPLRSVYTTNLPQLLEQLGISLLVSTYQAGKLVVLRADNGIMNTHFRAFNKPMGMAVDQNRLAIGTAHQIWQLYNLPDVGQRLEPVGKHDACYIPRNTHTTGDIDIHEMSWGKDDELWFVNTRFSCLCTLHPAYSFVPRWRPPFVTALAPEDRCHLNGLGMVGDRPKYVTALGKTDTNRGWREHKANGGVLIDIESNSLIMQGLSMPHSPRWYGDRLWLLESGNGSIATLDLDTNKLQTIAQLPGFTRGLDFYGNLAFIGLSQIRETAVFSGIPLTERLQERTCGIWVVDVLSGKTVAFLKFEDAVQEIFAVQVLHNSRFPEVIDHDDAIAAHSYVLPDEALADVPQLIR